MSIALFNEPIEVEITVNVESASRPALMLGIDASDAHDWVVVVEADGSIGWISTQTSRVLTKWRYDEAERDWIDHSGPEDESEASEEE